MSRYRTKLQIVAEILKIVRDGAKKTHIMYKANLSYRLLCRYLEDIKQCGLMQVDPDEHYVVASKGEEFLERYAAYLRRQEQVAGEQNAVNEERKFLEEKYIGSPKDANDDINLARKSQGEN